jgi:hypothetical protein
MARRRKSIGKSIQQVAPQMAGRGFITADAMLIDPVMMQAMPHVAADTMSPTEVINRTARFARRVHRKK